MVNTVVVAIGIVFRIIFALLKMKIHWASTYLFIGPHADTHLVKAAAIVLNTVLQTLSCALLSDLSHQVNNSNNTIDM
jgi:hypothetical protein